MAKKLKLPPAIFMWEGLVLRRTGKDLVWRSLLSESPAEVTLRCWNKGLLGGWDFTVYGAGDSIPGETTSSLCESEKSWQEVLDKMKARLQYGCRFQGWLQRFAYS